MLKMMIFMKNNTKFLRKKKNSRYKVGKIIQKEKLHSESCPYLLLSSYILVLRIKVLHKQRHCTFMNSKVGL